METARKKIQIKTNNSNNDLKNNGFVTIKPLFLTREAHWKCDLNKRQYLLMILLVYKRHHYSFRPLKEIAVYYVSLTVVFFPLFFFLPR